MPQRYLRSLVFISLILIFFLIYKNYKELYKYRDFSYSSKIKISLIFEAILDTRTDIYRIFDKFFYKNNNNKIKKVFLEVERGDLEKARNQWHDKILLNNQSENNFFSSKISLDENENDFQKASFRFRGKSDWHLRIDKPSLRIKLKNFQNYKKMKHINLTFPEGRGIIENYYANTLARKLGLIGHHSELVDLYINNINYGVYHLHSRDDESLIRLNERLPGPLLSGQNLNLDKWNIDDFEQINFLSINRNHDIFKRMIDELYKQKKDNNDWENLWNVINFENTAKSIALKTILGIIHDDYWHNHEFFYDKTIGKIEPIINDAQSLGTNLYPARNDRLSIDTFFDKEKPDFTVPINQKTNPFLNGIIYDTNFYHEKNQIIYELINNELSVKNQHLLLSQIFDRIDNSVYADKNKRYLVERINGWQIAKSSNLQYEVYKNNIFEYVENRNLFLNDQLSKNYLNFSFIQLKEFRNKKFLLFEYKGELPINLDTEQLGNIFIYDKNKKKFHEYLNEKLSLHTGLNITKNNNKLTNIKAGNDIFHDHHYETAYQSYLIKLDDKTDIDNLVSYFKTLNNVKLKKISFKEDLSINDIKYNDSTFHLWSNDLDSKNDITFNEGVHEIKDDIFIKKNQKLIINEGATLLLWPNVSIFSEGKVFIDGKTKGVVILNKFNNRPWGNFSIFGADTSGSYIKNANIKGGATKDINNILFSGMVNIFWNKDIELENLIVSNNAKGDDTLHFTKSEGMIKNLKIFDCLSDCIDMDYSSYTIKNLNCYKSLNDGLDLMESKVIGSNLNFSENLDKSLSIGEASYLKINNLEIINSNIGIASKDDSTVDLENINITNTNLALDTYRKNSRYNDSGKFMIKNKMLKNNKLDLRFTNKNNIFFDYKDLNFLEN